MKVDTNVLLSTSATKLVADFSAEENPDLPYDFIKGVLEAKSEMERGDISTFEFNFSAVSIKTKGFKFDREYANER